MTHYVCTGECHGVTDKEGGACQAEQCSKHGEPLVKCECSDGKHELAYKNASSDGDRG